MLRDSKPGEEFEPISFSGKKIRLLLDYYIKIYEKELSEPLEKSFQRWLAVIMLSALAAMGDQSDEYEVIPIGRYFATPTSIPPSPEDIFESHPSLSRFDSFIVRRKSDKKAMAVFNFGLGAGLKFNHEIESFKKQIPSLEKFIASPSCQLIQAILSQAITSPAASRKHPIFSQFSPQHAKVISQTLMRAQQQNTFRELFNVFTHGAKNIHGKEVAVYGEGLKGLVMVNCNLDQRTELGFLPLINEVYNSLELTFAQPLATRGEVGKLSDTKLFILPAAFVEHGPDLISSSKKYQFLALQTLDEHKMAEQKAEQAALVRTDLAPVKMIDMSYQIASIPQEREEQEKEWKLIFENFSTRPGVYKHTDNVDRKEIWVTSLNPTWDHTRSVSIKYIKLDLTGGVPGTLMSAASDVKSLIHPSLLLYDAQPIFVTQGNHSELYASFVTEKIEGTAYQLMQYFHAESDFRETAVAKDGSTGSVRYYTGNSADYMKALWYRFPTDIFNAFFYLHGRGIVHGDVCPNNIVYTFEGGEIRFKVSDTLIKKAVLDLDLEVSNTKVGTSGYLSPEQEYKKKEEKASDIRTPCGDVFSLGLVWFSFLSSLDGKKPYLKDKTSGHRVPLTSLASVKLTDPITGKVTYPGQEDFNRIITYVLNNQWGVKLKPVPNWSSVIPFILEMLDFNKETRIKSINQDFMNRFFGAPFKPASVPAIDEARFIQDVFVRTLK